MIVIVTYSSYPQGGASAIRYATFAKTYTDMGYKASVLHKSDGNKQNRGSSRIAKYSRYILFSHTIIKSLRKLRCEENIEAVIIGSDVESWHAMLIQRWCRGNGLKCVFDATEWYSKEQVANWRLSRPYWEKEILNRFVIDKRSRVIAISSYLYDYFKQKGCKVVRIPIFYNFGTEVDHPYNQIQRTDSVVRVIYAGSHLKMDNIPLIIEAMSLMPQEDRERLEFIIYGLSKAKIAACVSDDLLNKVDKSLCIMGRRPNSEVIEAYSRVDFSIVLRDPNLRVNKAGFPSKVVESMCVGVPVICNYSSDLQLYLRDKENCIIVNDLDVNTVSQLLCDLVRMPLGDRCQIGQNAISTVYQQLNSHIFEDDFRDIVL